jgi:hypothetical protein
MLCAYTSLRHGDAQELGWQHVHAEQELIKKQLKKTTVVGLIPYLDDVFRPVALLEGYRSLGLAMCLPFVRDSWAGFSFPVSWRLKQASRSLP